MFCHVASEQVFGLHDVTSVYHVPLLLQSQGIVEFLRGRLKLEKVNITKEMEDKGKSLGKRWKDITMGYVSSLALANSDQMHTLGRRGCLTPLLLRLSEIHRSEGLVHVCHKSSRTFCLSGASRGMLPTPPSPTQSSPTLNSRPPIPPPSRPARHQAQRHHLTKVDQIPATAILAASHFTDEGRPRPRSGSRTCSERPATRKRVSSHRKANVQKKTVALIIQTTTATTGLAT